MSVLSIRFACNVHYVQLKKDLVHRLRFQVCLFFFQVVGYSFVGSLVYWFFDN